jgi:hypothetical protein
MTEDQKKPDDAAETSDVERRDFLTKAFAAAGALAAGGVLASALSGDAEAATTVAPARRATMQRTQLVKDTPLRYSKLANGHEMTLGGKELNDILVREGLLSSDLTGKSSVMTLKLEWS